MGSLSLRSVSKSFGSVEAVKGVSLDIADEEVVIFVGPSGCGKTTLLRTIAGLEKPSSGIIEIDAQDVTGMSPSARNIAMVFQNYALYPHMTAYETMALPLQVRKFNKEEIADRVGGVADLLEIDKLLDRRPSELSGGQIQRVAVGRALVREPQVLLMDEPLSNLDTKLRVQMRTELRRLSREVKTTTIYVTHDQTEAMTLGDRVVVMNEGEIEQVDKPEVVYRSPASVFVAGMIGSPAINLWDVPVHDAGGTVWLRDSMVSLRLSDEAAGAVRQRKRNDGLVTVGIRPESIRIAPADSTNEQRFVCGEVMTREAHGPYTIFGVQAGATTYIVRADADAMFDEGQQVSLIASGPVLLFDCATSHRIA